jgi:hypothetical protein
MCVLHQSKQFTAGNEPENVQKTRAIYCKTQCHICGRVVVILRSCMLVKGVNPLLGYMFHLKEETH